MENLESIREKLVLPVANARLLLHCCCAPCACDIIETMLASSLTPTLFFYNPNIDPKKEYELRKDEIIKFATRKQVPFIDADYDRESWTRAVEGLEAEAEGGARCQKCFYLRLTKTADCCLEKGYNVFTTTLGISRYKNFDQITAIGLEIAKSHSGLLYWDHNWRKKGGSVRADQMAKREGFYRQEYCGCQFSSRPKSKEMTV